MAKSENPFGRLLREPLLHFMIFGGLIFGYIVATTPKIPQAADQIVITSAEVERMAVAWTQRWQRPPSENELNGMVDEAVREQVLYREALALGLDRDDVVIRRHLRQKYEFVTQDLAYDTDPDEPTLRAYFAAQPDRYMRAARVSFSHILFSPDRRGTTVTADAVQALADLQLATGPEAADLLGDATSLPAQFSLMSDLEVDAMFGPDFATALLDLAPKQWAGPIVSGYGLHLVWLTDKVSGGQLSFEEVRQRVKDDWVYDQRNAANEAVFAKLLARYEVVVEPQPTALPEGGSGS